MTGKITGAGDREPGTIRINGRRKWKEWK